MQSSSAAASSLPHMPSRHCQRYGCTALLQSSASFVTCNPRHFKFILYKTSPLELFQHLVDGAGLVLVWLFGRQLKHRLQGATAAASVPRSTHSTHSSRRRRSTANSQHDAAEHTHTLQENCYLRQHVLQDTLPPRSLPAVTLHLKFRIMLHMCYFCRSRCLTSSSSSSSAKAPCRACTLPGSGRLGAAASAVGTKLGTYLVPFLPGRVYRKHM